MDPTSLLFNRFFYWGGFVLFRTAYTVIWRLRIIGQENIPPTGPLLIASNHLSLADPPLIGCCIPRVVHFMAKAELFEIPLLGWFIRRVNAFPIRRVERDVTAFKTAQRILKSGGALILFPEGSRQRTGRLGAAKAGVGMLAVKTMSPVLPVFVHRSNELWRFKRVTVSFGRPLAPDPAADYLEFSQRIMAAIADLKEACLGQRP